MGTSLDPCGGFDMFLWDAWYVLEFVGRSIDLRGKFVRSLREFRYVFVGYLILEFVGRSINLRGKLVRSLRVSRYVFMGCLIFELVG